MNEFIDIYGAREHNLKNLNLKIPRSKLVVMTGVSGSGKSSLAFDTIYAEGQRRYLETLPNYARQFLGGLQRPKVDKIEGLSPVVAIEQKTISKNPRSTVGTITEIYGFLRVLFARISQAYSYNSNEKMVSYKEGQIQEFITSSYMNKKILILAPIIQSRKGSYQEVFNNLAKKGFLKVRVDGEVKELFYGMILDRYKVHDIELVVDQLKIHNQKEDVDRLYNTISLALKYGQGTLMILEHESKEVKFFSKSLSCPSTGISYPDPEPNTFSFNSPKGACSTCKGLGMIKEIDIDKVITDNRLSIYQGAIKWIGKYKDDFIFNQLKIVSKVVGFNIKEPIENISKEHLDLIFYGSSQNDLINKKFPSLDFIGIYPYMNQMEDNLERPIDFYEKYFQEKLCTECKGDRLKKQSLYFKIKDKNIAQVAQLEIESLYSWIVELENEVSGKEKKIAQELLIEIRKRIRFLMDVGLDYLSLNRPSASLSGGEAQRIRLSNALSSELSNVLYILDEPSIGLHQRDNQRLFDSLKKLVQLGNSVIIVEHDREIIEQADHIIDIGPHPGERGGYLLFNGEVGAFAKSNTLTARYIRNELSIKGPEKSKNQKIKDQEEQKYISLKGANGNNLKKVDLHIPLGKMICVTGVSGSGKSSLILKTLAPILSHHFYKSTKQPLAFDQINGLEYIDKVISIDQTPIGKTPRSTPATYTGGLFAEIRKLFSQTMEARIRGYQPGHFSFNLKQGRCSECQGGGYKIIEMNFLPDVHILCQKCQGRRFSKEIIDIKYKGKSIADVLEMKVEEAFSFFEPISKIYLPLKSLREVGLGYLSLGQSSTTLSGGEAQRIKLASELSRRHTGKTLYMLDECTTGLHFEDIQNLVLLLKHLVALGNTVLVIEHNIDFIKVADHIIDMGPDGGAKGGEIIAEGSLEEIIKNKKSQIGKYL